ncbi:MaoC/PaaZ C-terminal domain-containing protein [Streptomyces bobili]|uniref:MaoC family dehydratase n=1 Tax=Streptomyces bobili TaxID=67280 RepID=UPI00225B496B|nr:MaoC/PaaZ C-terminal domain-containing protein [Streptomyces bobili]MCX5525804.1 MaoC/PaaZ C-terminal domain-containing protein [Streptomyces bobili]
MTAPPLSASPALGPLLARGALLSPFKRPRPGAAFSGGRLVLPNLRVDLARLAAYERVCGFPTGDDALPVTYPHVLGFPLAMRIMSGRAFPLPLLGLVHTSISLTRHRPLPATGTTYELAVHVDRLAPHRRGTEAVVVTELREDGGGGEDGTGGEVVWESESRYLARHRADGQAPEPAPGSGEPPLPAAGPPLPVVDEWRLGADIGRRYGAVSGDRNPIHLSPLTARLFGFPRAIAHGMWTAARCLAAHGTPAAAHVAVDFRAPVLLPGTVAFAAQGGRFELRDTGGDGARVHVRGRVG